MKTCGVCKKRKPSNEFGKVAGVEACGPCMPVLIEANAKSIRKFADGLAKALGR